MKQKLLKFSVIILLIGCQAKLLAQQTLSKEITHDGITRAYTLYVPAQYSAEVAAPLVFCFHGYTSNGPWILIKSELKPVADTAGFIVVCPQATDDNAGDPSWNLYGANSGRSVDDVGFITTLLDKVVEDYTIDTNRVFSTGFSQGGFMSYILATQMNNRIAAIAPVSGNMLSEFVWSRDVEHPTPVLHIHGTSDPGVLYDGSTTYLSVDQSLDYWVNYNNCSTEPTITSLPDINTDDNSTVEHKVYGGGDKNTTVEHFKITNGLHYWPGFDTEPGNMDIEAAVEIWKFFSRYSLDELISSSGGSSSGTITSMALPDLETELIVYPNPCTSFIRIGNELLQPEEFKIYSSTGKCIEKGVLDVNEKQINIAALKAGFYFLNIKGKTSKFTRTK